MDTVALFGHQALVSLGCPKNQIDTEIMLKHLCDEGYEITGDETEADVVIINTCAFIESAKKEAIDNILDIAWLKENRSNIARQQRDSADERVVLGDLKADLPVEIVRV